MSNKVESNTLEVFSTESANTQNVVCKPWFPFALEKKSLCARMFHINNIKKKFSWSASVSLTFY